jgi:hypothetical protein
MTLAEKIATFFGLGSVVVVAGGLWWMMRSTDVSTEIEEDTPPVVEPPPTEAPTASQRSAAEKTLRQEAQIKDVLWAGPILYVGMLDDGKPRDGYAMYVCEVLREHQAASGVTVIIKDIAKMVGRGEDVKLGKARC